MPPGELLKREQILLTYIQQQLETSFSIGLNLPRTVAPLSRQRVGCPPVHCSGDLPWSSTGPPPGPPGQLPAGGSLMPRFKCKFPGHRAPTAGADDYIRIAKRRRRRQHWWCLSLSRVRSKHATQPTFANIRLPAKIWRGTFDKQTSLRKKQVNLKFSDNVNYCAVCWPVCGGESRGINCSWQSKMGSKIDPRGPVRPV